MNLLGDRYGLADGVCGRPEAGDGGAASHRWVNQMINQSACGESGTSQGQGKVGIELEPGGAMSQGSANSQLLLTVR